MAEIIDFPRRNGGAQGGGGGQPPTLDWRVAQIEADSKELKSDMKAVRSAVDRIEAKLGEKPNSFQVFGMVFGIWAAGIALVFTLLRFVQP